MSSMGRRIAVALMVAALALPACAQRGAVGGGSMGHSGGSIGHSGGFASHGSLSSSFGSSFANRGGGFTGRLAPAYRGGYAPMGRSSFAPTYRGNFASRSRTGPASTYRGGYAPTGRPGVAPSYRGSSTPARGTSYTGATQFNGSQFNGSRGTGITAGPPRGGQNNNGGGQYGGSGQSDWRHGHGGDGQNWGDNDSWAGLPFYGAGFGAGLGLGYPYGSGFWLNPYEMDFLDTGFGGSANGNDSSNASPDQPQYDPSQQDQAQNDPQPYPAQYDAQNDPQNQPQPYAAQPYPAQYQTQPTAQGQSTAQNQAPNEYSPSLYAAPPIAYTQPPPSSQSYDDSGVILVFKDGRPPEQIHNYILTRTAIYLSGQRRRVIPIDQLDLTATEKVNRDAGLDFQLPDAQ